MMHILLTGAGGLIGRNLIERSVFSSAIYPLYRTELDLENQLAVKDFFQRNSFDIVIHLAALVGGINANSNHKLAFFEKNMAINFNVIEAAIKANTEFIVAAGTGCAYPKRLEGQLLREGDYLDGYPELTNDAYAFAKRAMLCHLQAASETQNTKFCYFLPANIYGPYDNFNAEMSHVVPGLIRRMDLHRNGEFRIWGSGQAQRDFLFISDLVRALDLIIAKRLSGVVNIGSGRPTSIIDLAEKIAGAMSLNATLSFDTNMPDGQSVRLMDCSKIANAGWKPRVSLKQGLIETVDWYKQNLPNVRK